MDGQVLAREMRLGAPQPDPAKGRPGKWRAGSGHLATEFEACLQARVKSYDIHQSKRSCERAEHALRERWGAGPQSLPPAARRCARGFARNPGKRVFGLEAGPASGARSRGGQAGPGGARLRRNRREGRSQGCPAPSPPSAPLS